VFWRQKNCRDITSGVFSEEQKRRNSYEFLAVAVFVCGTDNNIFFFMVLAINQWDSEVKRRKEFFKICEEK